MSGAAVPDAGVPDLARRVLLVQSGHRPNELVVKKLAMLGCVAMVLAHSVRERPEQLRINAYAGGCAWQCTGHSTKLLSRPATFYMSH